MMADLIFTSEELYSLTEKLGSVATTLSEREWEILLTIFANGTDRIQGNPEQNEGTLPEAQLSQDVERITDPRAATAEELGNQLHHSYVPGPPRPGPMIFRITPPPPSP
jgi:hypothetical protein